jgi:hypothetical protein
MYMWQTHPEGTRHWIKSMAAKTDFFSQVIYLDYF